jgi:hypothetical protein
MKSKIIELALLYFICAEFLLFGTTSLPPINGSARVSIRGNSLDIHFVNLTGFKIKITPNFFKNSSDLPKSKDRNLLFIPNLGKNKNCRDDMPIPFSLDPMAIYTENGISRFIAKKFIQGILIYNNPASYYNDDRELIYNSNSRVATYSSYMWTNGVRTRNDGNYAFANAIDELNNFYYSIMLPIDNQKFLTCNIKFAALSNLSSVSITNASTTGYIQDFNNIAAILTIVAGILNIPTNAPAGVVTLLSGVAWTISGTGWMIESTYSKTKYKLYNNGSSWLSSPFDVYVFPENFYIRDKNNRKLSVAEYDETRCRLNYFLGTKFKPESIFIQIASSPKGDLYIYLISKTVLNKINVNELLKTNEFQINKMQ